ncbi:MAG: hypothetical protein ACI841_002767 [Planctomycetota bacterium]|jgi:hypothetical protein
MDLGNKIILSELHAFGNELPERMVDQHASIREFSHILRGVGGFAFAIAQALLAVGFAFQSGADSALHFDSLAALGRQSEFAERESRAMSAAFAAITIAALVGGAVASQSLRLAYLLSAAGALFAGALTYRFVEPPRHTVEPVPQRQLRSAIMHLRTPPLRWLFVFTIVMAVLNHVPY